MAPKLTPVDQFIAARVAFILLATPSPPDTREEAARLLGVPPHASREEIEQAYKEQAKKNHPDRGGDPDRMVEFNVARDILEGKREDRWKAVEPEDEGGGYAAPGSGGFTPPVERKVEVSLHDAMQKEGVPSGVQWILASNTSHGDRDMGAYSLIGVVYYGKTDTKHVFVGVYHDGGTNPFTRLTTNIFSCIVKTFPITGSIAEIAPRAFRDIFSGFSGLRKGYNAKVTVLPDGFDLTERNYYNPPGKEMSFKDAMVNLGLVGDEHRWKTNQKLKVILIYHDEGFGEERKKSLDLEINGRTYALNQDSVNFFTRKFEKNLRIIFGDRYYDGSKKDLTRIRNGKVVLAELSSALKTEPQEIRDLLAQASAQMP